MSTSSTDHLHLFQLNVLLVVIPYIFSLLEIGVSALRATLFTKKINPDSKYAFIRPRQAEDATASTPRVGVVEGGASERSRHERLQGKDVVAEVDVGFLHEGSGFKIATPFDIEVAC